MIDLHFLGNDHMKVVLFGSRAPGGQPTEQSDFDLAWVISNDVSKLEMVHALNALYPNATVQSFPEYGPKQAKSLLHFLVMTESELIDPIHPLSRNIRAGQVVVS